MCDELDKAKDLHDYFKDRLTKHIKNIVLTHLEGKEGEHLLKIYIKEWEDYTILVHFMRKMFNYLVDSTLFIGFLGSILSEEQQHRHSGHSCIVPVQGSVLQQYRGPLETGDSRADH